MTTKLSGKQRLILIDALVEDFIGAMDGDRKFKDAFLRETLELGREGFVYYTDGALINACEDAGLEDVLQVIEDKS